MRPDIGDTCRSHLDYMRWADELALAAVAEFMPASITTLQHIYLGEQVWLARVQGDTKVRLSDLEAPADIAALRRVWPDMHRAWLHVAASTQDWARSVAYTMSSGEPGRSPLWEIVLHLTNHGSYHRGQVAAMLRAAGFDPPATDLIRYYRLRA